MSHDPSLALTLPVEPVTLIAAAVAALVVTIAAVVLRKVLGKKARRQAWRLAAHELGLDLVAGGSDLGPVAKGRVNMHPVSFAPAAAAGRRSSKLNTSYLVKYEAPEAPDFRLTARSVSSTVPTLDTGDPSFDALVAIETDHPGLLCVFLTPARRAIIRRLIQQWQAVEITNRTVHVSTLHIERDAGALVDTICHLVAAAEIFDRPTRFAGHVSQEVPAPVELGVDSMASMSAHATADHHVAVHGDSDVLTVVRLDEESVIRELFNDGLTSPEITARFDAHYRGHAVRWTGEIVRVGSDAVRPAQRIAALIGSADGRDPSSGRVVAITLVGPEPRLQEGDVVSFSGTLANLDVDQRLFHLT